MLSRSTIAVLRATRSRSGLKLASVVGTAIVSNQNFPQPMSSATINAPFTRAYSDSPSTPTGLLDSEIQESLEPEEQAEPVTKSKEVELHQIENELMNEDFASPSNPDMPWYLEVDPPVKAPSHLGAPRPELPANPPFLLDPLVTYAYDDMGLDDLKILDLRDFDPPPALGPHLLMIFGTARSERHLHVVAARLQRWLRYNYHVEAAADGLIGAGELRTKLRRLRRKAKIMGSGTVFNRGGDDGISTGWICVNLGTIGNLVSEELRVDTLSKMSGFGGSTDGTTIVMQIMTESRRAELDLEGLWTRSLQGNRKMRERMMMPLDDAYKPAVPNNWDKKLRRKRKRAEKKGLVVEGEAQRG